MRELRFGWQSVSSGVLPSRSIRIAVPCCWRAEKKAGRIDGGFASVRSGLRMNGWKNIWPYWRERRTEIAKSFDEIMAALPSKRREKIEYRTQELATLHDLRRAAELTQAKLASTPQEDCPFVGNR
jgi:hypothetical protein